MFLPEIKKANEELFEKINREGHESIIVDSNLAPSSADDQQVIVCCWILCVLPYYSVLQLY